MKRVLALSVLAAFAAAAPAAAQSPAPAAAAASPSPDEGPTATLPPPSDTIKSILDEELAPPPGGYTYNPQGRRDPFMSLVKPVAGGGADKRTGRPGMEGFLIQEVALKGVVRDRSGFIAILLGTDGKSYFVRNGQRLYDGVVTAVDAASVTFRQEVTDPLATVKSRDVRKTLYPSEEGR